MSFISDQDKRLLIEELTVEVDGKLDGGRKNIVARACPHCGKTGGKYAIYVGPDVGKKRFGMSNCFSCGSRYSSLNATLESLGRTDLKFKETIDLYDDITDELNLFEDDEIDDELIEVEMPDGWKRVFRNDYLKSRHWRMEDYDMFPVGTTRGLNRKFDDYVVLPIIDDGRTVGYIGRIIYDKEYVDEYNRKHRMGYQLRRYMNSNDTPDNPANDFSKLLYNYDSVIEGVTRTVLLTEGIFDTISMVRKFQLYENHRFVPVATFGKKISDIQMFKLQQKGVEKIVIGYDTDAHEASAKAAEKLEEYFDVYILDLKGGKDLDEASYWDIYDSFSERLLTPKEFNLTVWQN